MNWISGYLRLEQNKYKVDNYLCEHINHVNPEIFIERRSSMFTHTTVLISYQIRIQIPYVRIWVLDFAQQDGKGREGNGRAYPCRMLVAGEAPDEELAGGATRPVAAARKGRPRQRIREGVREVRRAGPNRLPRRRQAHGPQFGRVNQQPHTQRMSKLTAPAVAGDGGVRRRGSDLRGWCSGLSASDIAVPFRKGSRESLEPQPNE
jgi:hypothetical protein